MGGVRQIVDLDTTPTAAAKKILIRFSLIAPLRIEFFHRRPGVARRNRERR